MNPILENVQSDGMASLVMYLYDEDSFTAPWHYHPQYELTLILEGSGMRYVGNHVESFQEGELVLLGAGLPHCWRMSKRAESQRARSFIIQWSGDIFPYIPEFQAIRSLFNRAQRGIRFRNEDVAELENLYSEMMRLEEPMERYLSFTRVLNHLALLDKPTYLAGESYRIDTSDQMRDRLALIHQYLSDHFQNKIRLEDMADLLGMTRESFSRFFSKAMQKPFFSFLNEYRVNRASRMLMETDMQIAEIAYKCGYESLPFFYKQFKKFKNYSPVSFRKLYLFQSNQPQRY
ncbi:MAG: AraC family transcriptional regulator [Cyclobacteriaceae bacterium]